MKETFICAFATDNGKDMMTRHFGDARYYDIYKISSSDSVYIGRIDNTVDEEDDVHADPEKARGIKGILKQHNVQVCVSPVFGPNIKRIKKHFVCIVSGNVNIELAVKHTQHSIENIAEEWSKGEDRSIIHWRRSEDVS